MQFRIICLVLGLLICSGVTFAQKKDTPKQPRILILLDGSSSMLQPWSEGENRFKAAAEIINKLIDSVYQVNDQVEFALRVYGHQSPAQENNCFDTRLEVMFSKDNRTQMSLRLEALHPFGVTPIAFSVKEAAEKDMVDVKNNEYSLILITDGGESCGGNLCEVVRTLLAKKINFKPYILSLVDYAPLKQQYDCLGNYLVVTNDTDLKKAVGTIVEAYTPMLTLNAIDRRTIEKVAANPPSVLKMDIPAFKMDIEKEPEAAPVKEVTKPKPISEPVPVKEPEIKQPAPSKDLTNRTFEPRLKQNISRLAFSSSYRLLPQRYATPSFKRIIVNKFIPPIIPPDPAPVSKPKEQPKPVVISKPVKSPPPPIEAKVDVSREEAKETTLELYFWDGKGKYYHTSPAVILSDPQTKQVVQRFYRTVDAAGNPDPQTNIKPGVYELSIEKSRVFVPKIEVKPNQKNVYKIIGGSASLRFEYEDDPEQPVREYIAQVKKNFEPGPVIDQYCYQELEYEPGNYHIIINTLPVSHKSVDLEFGALVTIRIEKPGIVQFTNTEAYGHIELYCELGDQFVRFSHTLEITGNPEQQKLELQRGRYRVGYRKYPNAGSQSPVAFKEFIIKSKQITEVHLD